MNARRLLVTLLVAMIVLLASCEGPFAGHLLVVEREDEQLVSMSITPAPQEPTAYRIAGAGPGGETFSRNVTELPTTVNGLASGEWRIEVEGLDASGDVILEGSGVSFVSDEHAPLARIVLAPPPGTGSVQIELSWPAELVASPQPEAVLHAGDNPAASLDCSVFAGDGTATCTAESIPSGWYRLELLLYDGEQSVAGQADLLSVATGTTTDAVLSFERINRPGRPITVNGSSFRLLWDPGESHPVDPVTHYRIYYRDHGTYLWSFLARTDGSLEQFEVSTAVLDYGTYDFAVTAVSAAGRESMPLTSLCDDAYPQTGWFVEWSPDP
jgi:hypothetical protein